MPCLRILGTVWPRLIALAACLLALLRWRAGQLRNSVVLTVQAVPQFGRSAAAGSAGEGADEGMAPVPATCEARAAPEPPGAGAEAEGGYSARGRHVAVCIAGEVRTFGSPLVWRSQVRHVLEPLRREGFGVHVVAVFGDRRRERTAEVEAILNATFPTVAVDYHASRQGLLGQFDRLRRCGELLPRRRYDWTVRLRPDLFFYGDIPRLQGLSDAFVYARVRCMHTTAGWRHESEEIAQEVMGPGCEMYGCPKGVNFRIDDQFVLAPWRWHNATLGQHWRPGCPDRCATCCITESMRVFGVPFRSLAVPFCIARWEGKFKGIFWENYTEPDGTQLSLSRKVFIDVLPRIQREWKADATQRSQHKCPRRRTTYTSLAVCSPPQSGSELVRAMLPVLGPLEQVDSSCDVGLYGKDGLGGSGNHFVVVVLRHPVDAVVSAALQAAENGTSVTGLTMEFLQRFRARFMDGGGKALLANNVSGVSPSPRRAVVRYETLIDCPGLAAGLVANALGFVTYAALDGQLEEAVKDGLHALYERRVEGPPVPEPPLLRGFGDLLTPRQASAVADPEFCQLVRQTGYRFAACT